MRNALYSPPDRLTLRDGIDPPFLPQGNSVFTSLDDRSYTVDFTLSARNPSVPIPTPLDGVDRYGYNTDFYPSHPATI